MKEDLQPLPDKEPRIFRSITLFIIQKKKLNKQKNNLFMGRKKCWVIKYNTMIKLFLSNSDMVVSLVVKVFYLLNNVNPKHKNRNTLLKI